MYGNCRNFRGLAHLSQICFWKWSQQQHTEAMERLRWLTCPGIFSYLQLYHHILLILALILLNQTLPGYRCELSYAEEEIQKSYNIFHFSSGSCKSGLFPCIIGSCGWKLNYKALNPESGDTCEQYCWIPVFCLNPTDDMEKYPPSEVWLRICGLHPGEHLGACTALLHG